MPVHFPFTLTLSRTSTHCHLHPSNTNLNFFFSSIGTRDDRGNLYRPCQASCIAPDNKKGSAKQHEDANESTSKYKNGTINILTYIRSFDARTDALDPYGPDGKFKTQNYYLQANAKDHSRRMPADQAKE